jgi:hypothetical protein
MSSLTVEQRREKPRKWEEEEGRLQAALTAAADRLERFRRLAEGIFRDQAGGHLRAPAGICG